MVTQGNNRNIGQHRVFFSVTGGTKGLKGHNGHKGRQGPHRGHKGSLGHTEETRDRVSWVPVVFLVCGGNFTFRPRAKATSSEAARKTSGTVWCFLRSPLTFELFYRITFMSIRMKVSNHDFVGRHVKKCPKTTLSLAKQVRV